MHFMFVPTGASRTWGGKTSFTGCLLNEGKEGNISYELKQDTEREREKGVARHIDMRRHRGEQNRGGGSRVAIQ